MSNAVAIDALEKRLADLERKGNALVAVINDMRAEDGMPPLPPFGGGSGGGVDTVGRGSVPTTIKPDTFYGKKAHTAIREYLDMRKAAGSGPGTVREIFEALKAGGLQFGAQDEKDAMDGLRVLMRKRTHFFHKMPNGTYGLTAWYPNARPARPAARANAETTGGTDPMPTETATAAPSKEDAAAA